MWLACGFLVFLPLCTAFSTPIIGCMSGETGLCSDRGKCIDELTNQEVFEAYQPGTKCVCDSGWTGHADFINTFNHDCSTHIPTITALWVLNLVTSVFLILFATYKLLRVFTILKRNQETLSWGGSQGSVSKSKSQNKSPRVRPSAVSVSVQNPLFWSFPLVRFAVIGIFQSLMLIILCGLKLSWNYFAGQDYGLAILMIFNVNTFWCACLYFLKNWMEVNVKLSRFHGDARRSAKEIMKKFNIYLKITLFIALLSPIPVLLITIVQNKQNGKLANIFTALFWLLHVVTEILLASSVVWTGIQIRKLLEAHEGISRPGGNDTHADKEKAIKGLSFMINQVSQSGVMNAALGLVVAFWPWLRNKSTYMLCFGTIAIPMLFISALLILTPPRKQKKTPAVASPVQKPHLVTTSSHSPQPSTEEQRPLNPENENGELEIPYLEHGTLIEAENNDIAEHVDIVENADTGEIELLSYSGVSTIIDAPSALVRASGADLDSP